jgi:patatin-related protein
MTDDTPAQGAQTQQGTPVDFTQEIRFAVVMYGGSSLAIYMNGVAQELLRLVRSTAPRPGDKPQAYLSDAELDGTERVYRKLGRILARGEEPPPAVGEEPPPPAGVKKEDWFPPVEVPKQNKSLRTRFVIDILTGTSAGGINAVYLAKALANDQPLDELKKLWISEGDVGVLLNDEQSDKGIRLGGQKPPGSLLNSRRMYLKLLQALRGMDKAKAVARPTQESPFVDELDLFVTATDMDGRVIPLRLADGVAYERHHRSVFRFRYFTEAVGGEHRNDFLPQYNPFLAFASRCTSAHQAAFEVMRLVDIEPALTKWPSEGAGEYGDESEELKKFYREYVPLAAGDGGRTVPFPERSFSDGGVLDNSPFSFASDALPFRHADFPVDRKLIYIEPSPEHPELEQESAERPDFFKNVLMALSTLPRYQTIVEDLMRVLERNRLIERVSHILLGLEDDLKWKRTHQRDYEEPPHLDELLKDRAELVKWVEKKREDLSWGGYQRLRVAEVTDDLAQLVARAAGFDEESGEFTAIRYLLREWRDDNFYDADQSKVSGEGGEESEQRRPQVVFLLLFDMMWLVRRLKFVLRKINEISCFDERAWQVLEAARSEGEPLWRQGERPSEDLRHKMSKVLLNIKPQVAAALTALRVARRRLWSRGEENPFRPYVAALDISSEDLIELLKQPTDEARRRYAKDNLLDKRLGKDAPTATRRGAVVALTNEVEAELRKATGDASGRCCCALAPPDEREKACAGSDCGDKKDESDLERTLRDTLWYYYRHFDEYDQVAHPILHATDAGDELDHVEVFRISPEDATFLINEREKRVSKLAGTTLGHFGAFFEERFRYNDIMWGRLDAAERIICALLPNDSHERLRDRLTAEAHRAIIIDEMLERHHEPEDKTKLRRLARGELEDAGEDGKKLAADLAAKLDGAGINPSLKDLLVALLRNDDPLVKFRQDFFNNYESERAFTPRDTVVNAGRASRIFGRMVDGIAAERRGGNKLVLWLVRLTRWVWGLAEVAVPDSIPNLVAFHLLRVIYFFEVALIVLGVVFAWKEVQRFGLIGLALTATLHVVILFVGDFVRGGPAGGNKLWRWLKLAFRMLLVTAVVGGLGFLLFKTNKSWLPNLLDYLIHLLEGWNKVLKPTP